jgi:DNA-binding PadR family transcriptional regulator
VRPVLSSSGTGPATWGNLSSRLINLDEASYIATQNEFVQKKPRTMIHMTTEGRAALHSYREIIRRVLG